MFEQPIFVYPSHILPVPYPYPYLACTVPIPIPCLYSTHTHTLPVQYPYPYLACTVLIPIPCLYRTHTHTLPVPYQYPYLACTMPIPIASLYHTHTNIPVPCPWYLLLSAGMSETAFLVWSKHCQLHQDQPGGACQDSNPWLPSEKQDEYMSQERGGY